MLAAALQPLGTWAQPARPIPQIVEHNGQYQFLVDGKPYLMLSGQVHNSSASSIDGLSNAWRSFEEMHANTAEIPLYWELVEPEPGQFDFHLIDEIVKAARSHSLRVVFLWFATWKNGEMHYAPGWVKANRQKYRRVVNALGEEMDILSPLCDACRQADEHAFAGVMQHIRAIDEADRTVIMMQVENETGLLGTDRDYSPEATKVFEGVVPGELMSYLGKHQATLAPALEEAWTASGSRRSGTWTEVFGDLAPEAFSAWSVARYVDGVAAAGKQAYPLPMYVNNWLVNPGNERAGRWPSGGPTVHVLDIWKAEAPHVDLLAPDIYLPDFPGTAAAFARPDNPLFVPETAPRAHYAAYVFLTLARFNGLGFSPFGVDGSYFMDLEKGTLSAEGGAEFANAYHALQPLLPMIEKYRYSGKMFAVVQDEDQEQAIPVAPHLAAVVRFLKPYALEGPRGGGLVIALAPDDFVVAGGGFSVYFRELEGPPRDAEVLSIEKGRFDGEQWVPSLRLNGDELHVSLPGERFHVSMPEKAECLRVRLIRK